METKLAGIARAAKLKPEERFTSLAHLINVEMIIMCHREMSSNKAAGVDEVTKKDYEANLTENAKELIGRMKRQAYKPQPVRRVYIPKPGTNKTRPLGIPAYEDKLVQAAMTKILNAIYEQDFVENSFGFRPNRGCHDALKVLNKIVNMKEIKYVVDADIKGFFEHVDHEWILKFLQHRIADPNIIRLIARFLKSEIMEAGIRYDTPEGTPQGGPISPILGNIYLHYVLDLWFEKKIRKNSKGQAFMVRYADDTIFCFEYEEDAAEFYPKMKDRLRAFNLEVAEEKTEIIKLGKDDNDKDDNNDAGGDAKTGTFDFLGFTHYVGTGIDGRKRIKRKTSRKKYNAGLHRCREWIKKNRHMPTVDFMKKIKAKVQGHCNYYSVTDNVTYVNNFIHDVRKLIYKWLNRRSQRKSFCWGKFNLFLEKYPLPKARIRVNIFEPGIGYKYVLRMVK